MKAITIIFILILTITISAQDLTQSAEDYLKQIKKPESIRDFDQIKHLPPVNQDTTNACWSFATLSFIESEMIRLGREPVKLAMMYPVYYMFIEKARYYAQTKGESNFAPGDLFTGVMETIRQYGIVPIDAYVGQSLMCNIFNHKPLEKELKELMKQIKTLKLWDEELVTGKVKQILDKYMGAPPEEFEYKGKKYTPRTFADNVVDLPWEEYIIVTSFLYEPFKQFIALDVPDNWEKREVYFNVPLDLFYASLKDAVKNGYSAAFDSDTGEPGRIGKLDAVFVFPFDIPGENISQPAREFRFKNKSTTDDHLMHIIGFKENEEQDWFLVKDSWRTAWDGKEAGYYFFHGDYIKLKALAYMVHKDAVPEIVKLVKNK